MAYLMGDPVQKATIVARGDALGYTFHLPDEDRYLHTREELIDWMKIGLAGRAAEQVVFGRVTNGAANDLEKVTSLARAMVFEYGMSEGVVSRTMRADNYALSEETKRLRDSEQARLTDGAYEEAIRLLEKHRSPLDRVAGALLEKETLHRDDLATLLSTSPRSRGRATRSALFGCCRTRTAARAGVSSIGAVEALRIHHLGVAVEDLDDAVGTYQRLFGGSVEHRGTLEDQGVQAVSMRVGESRVELMGSLGRRRRSASSSPSGGPACTTSPTRSTISRRPSATSPTGAPSSSTRSLAPASSASRSHSSIPTPSTASLQNW